MARAGRRRWAGMDREGWDEDEAPTLASESPLVPGGWLCTACGATTSDLDGPCVGCGQARILPLPPPLPPPPPPPVPPNHGEVPSRSRRPLVLAAAACLCLLLIGGVLMATSGDDADQDASTTGTGGVGDDGAAAVEFEPDTSRPSDGNLSSGEANVPSSTSAPPERAWVVSLGSYETESEAVALSSGLPGTGVLHSNDYSSLNPGWWVVYYDGNFQSGDDAVSYCYDTGRSSRDACYARLLSTEPGLDPNDQSLVVYPD